MKRLATVLVAVAALLSAGLTAPADAGNPNLGRLRANDQVLRKGCHNYRYAYQVTARAEEWALETFLRDPTGEIIASNAKDSMVDAKAWPRDVPVLPLQHPARPVQDPGQADPLRRVRPDGRLGPAGLLPDAPALIHPT